MKRKILICADVGVGKSTLIRKYTEHIGLPVYGFVTKRLAPDADGFHPIYIHPASQPESERRYEPENMIGTCTGRVREINKDVFNTEGARLIRDAWDDGIIVMDELGFMEADAEAFTEAVFEALDGDIPVIAAVKSRRDIPFLEKVRNHPAAEVLWIDQNNRDEVCEMLCEEYDKRKATGHKSGS